MTNCCGKQCEVLLNRFLIKDLNHKLNLLCHLPLSSIIDEKIRPPTSFSTHPPKKISTLTSSHNPPPTKNLAGGSYDPPPDPLVVRVFLPSAIAVLRLRRLIPISPPNKNTRPISPPNTKS